MTAFRDPVRFLDDPDQLRAGDPERMFEMAENFADQCQEGLRRGEDAAPHLDASYLRPANIVIAGMGGSAISGDLLAAIFSQRLKIPVAVVRDYHLPAFVSRKTLLFAVSHSGNTAETIHAFEEGLKRGARLVAISSGGKLKGLAMQASKPWIEVPMRDQPKAYLRPRACTGFLLMPMVAITERLSPRIVKPESGATQEAIEMLCQQGADYGRESPTSKNPAKRLAIRIAGKFPLVYGAVPWLGPVAFRWRTQFNENSKALALSHELPELDHNEVMGWRRGAATLVQPICIWLRPRDEDFGPQMQDRLRFTPRIADAPAYQEECVADGKSRLAQVLSLVHLGDMVSLYLALLYGVDPADTGPIARLKVLLEEAECKRQVERKAKRS
jgi:glucose/mannose-6-phosphate isomerase